MTTIDTTNDTFHNAFLNGHLVSATVALTEKCRERWEAAVRGEGLEPVQVDKADYSRELSPETEATLARFWVVLRSWVHWCRGNQASAERRLATAQNYPWGAYQHSNLRRGSDGSIWKSRTHWDQESNTYTYGWVRMERENPSEPLSDYVEKEFVAEESRGNRTLPNGVTIGEHLTYDDPESWQARAPSSSYGGHSEREGAKHSIKRAKLSVEFGEHLLAQKGEISEWLQSYARYHGDFRKDRKSCDGDMGELVSRFAKEFAHNHRDVNDNGSVLCELHATLDTLAGHHNVRAYCY